MQIRVILSIKEDIMKLTEEQEMILKVSPGSFDVMKVNAFAGTGKSSTLEEYAKRYQDTTFLYLTFNKASASKANLYFPKNVTCSTIHSLAYRNQSAFIRTKKNSSARSSLSLNQIFTITNIGNKIELNYISKIITSFCYSDDKEISHKHIPADIIDRIQRKFLNATTEYQESIRKLLEYAKKVWDTISSDACTEITHDIYLKLFSLEEDLYLPFDIVMLDEAQDSNPVTISLLKRFKKPLIIVGDQYQKIYTFRGTQNAMQAFPADKEFFLTGSFRFGDEIAHQANQILSLLLNEQVSLKGLAKNSVKLKKTCYIARTNAELFEKLIEWEDKTYRLIGNVSTYSYEFNKLEEIYWLWKDRREVIRSEEINEFESFQELKDYANETGDIVTLRNCLFVEKYGDRVPNILEKIESNIKKNDPNASTIISTCHKAKGLEFDKVILLDDFKYPYRETPMGWEYKPILDDESHLLYVAVTRAKQEVLIPETLSRLLSYLDSRKKTQETPIDIVSSSKKKVVKVKRKRTAIQDEALKERIEDSKPTESPQKYAKQVSVRHFMEGPLGTSHWDQRDDEIYYEKFFDGDNYEAYSEDTITEVEDWGVSLDDQDGDYWENYFDVVKDDDHY